MAVGLLGEVLVTLGALVALFVVWQVWWTDVAAGAVQAERVTTFEAATPDRPARVGTPQAGTPPVVETPGEGDTFALLHVPRWGADYVMPVSEGVDRAGVLDSLGIGHYPGTAQVGEVGNLALAGHRQSHGRPFFSVDTLVPGDALVLETQQAWYVYRVSESRIVSPDAVEVIAPVPGSPQARPTSRMITLTTCHPLFSTRERFVVHGVLEHWVDRAEGRPAALAPPGPA